MLLATAVTVGIHLASAHLQPELAQTTEGYNNANPGLYVRSAEGWQVGGYWNSHRQPTLYAGKSWTLAGGQNWDAGLLLAGATGYPAGAVVPLIAASVRLGPIRLSATPRIGNKASAVLHLSLERSF